MVVSYHCHKIKQNFSYYLFGIKINFIEGWLKLFKTNYLRLTIIYCEIMHEMFNKIPVAIPEPNDYKIKYNFF